MWAKRLASPQFGHHKVVQFAARGVIGTGQREDVATQPIEQGAHIRSQIDGLGLGLGGKAKLFGKALFARQRVSAWSLPCRAGLLGLLAFVSQRGFVGDGLIRPVFQEGGQRLH